MRGVGENVWRWNFGRKWNFGKIGILVVVKEGKENREKGKRKELINEEIFLVLENENTGNTDS